MPTFLHTADWQLGKPYGAVSEPEKRAALQKERFDVVARIGQAVREHGAAFVVVAGDLFDSPSPAGNVVSRACSEIGKLEVPVYVIPGNHDHGGPLGPWDQSFLRQEREQLAPNLHVLLDPQPVHAPGALLFPCPLLRRQESEDLTVWLRHPDAMFSELPAHLPRIVVAHGSVHGFGGDPDPEDPSAGVNRLDLTSLSQHQWDYIALGDWHGCKQVAPNAWYAGTPEPDRFPRGADYLTGHVLVVNATRNDAATVSPVATGGIGWHTLAHTFIGDESVDALGEQYTRVVGNRVGRDLLRLELDGGLGMSALDRLDGLLETWSARLLLLDRRGHVTMAATEADIARLTERAADPLTARIASLLRGRLADPAHRDLAESCLRELHLAVSREI